MPWSWMPWPLLAIGLEGSPEFVDVVVLEGLGALDADPAAESIEPVAQIDVFRQGPAGQVDLDGIGVGVVGAIGFQHVRRLGVVPPRVPLALIRETHLLDRVALQPLPDEGTDLWQARKTQGLQLTAADPGVLIGELPLRYRIPAKEDATAAVQEPR